MIYVQRDYFSMNLSPDDLSREISEFFKEEGFKTQCYKSVSGTVVQAQKGGIFRTILRKNRAYTILVISNGIETTIRLGISRWIETPDNKNTDPLFKKPHISFVEIPEALWTFYLEHEFWHFIETQNELEAEKE